MSYLVDSDWLIDAFLGIPAAVNLLTRNVRHFNRIPNQQLPARCNLVA